jgi:phosphoribosylformylglycinamidine cyclo-ligase
MYPAGEYDLAGFAVGLVEKEAIISGRSICPGDVVLGLQSSGAHANGYSLIRKIIERSGVDLHHPDNHQLALDLLAPTRIYVKPLLALVRSGIVKGMAHITGGGLTENIPRVLPQGVTAELKRDSWEAPTIFAWLQKVGNVDDAEMARTFNCGIGMVVVVAEADADRAKSQLEALGERVYRVGEIRARADGDPQTLVR